MENSPLGRLAPELRNRIYELTFEDPGPFTNPVDLGSISKANGLTRTCRVVRGETHTMFYASHRLQEDRHVDTVGRSAPTAQFCALLRLLGPAILCRLRSLTFSYWVNAHGAFSSEKFDVEIVGEDQRAKGETSSIELDGDTLVHLRVVVREKILGILADMGLDVEVVVQDGRRTSRKERWILAKPTNDGGKASSKPA